mmetsp:Transcript_9746/g.35709  ORF Transcript_9746/g.35709 Transcript_9746/m.35709 type:complete len:103 (-) Transcript_9746:243-551(-)
MATRTTRLSVEFSGGLEALFGGAREKALQVEHDEGELTVRQLLEHLRLRHLQERPELFLKDDSVRPGVLVLVNECDWELLGKLDSPLQDGDVVSFISTLHGG